jgi:CheY-like chemotaxis protein
MDTDPSKLTLLYVEDQPIIQLELDNALIDAGYETMVAFNGEEALRLLESRCGEIAGLVTDIDLGGCATGWDVARRARELLPQIPVVYASGGSGVTWCAQGVPLSVMIDKPFVSSQVLVAMAILLNGLTPVAAHA